MLQPDWFSQISSILKYSPWLSVLSLQLFVFFLVGGKVERLGQWKSFPSISNCKPFYHFISLFPMHILLKHFEMDWRYYAVSTPPTRILHGYFRKRICSCCCLVTQSIWLFATSWTVAHRALLSMGLSRQEYWSGFPFLLQGVLSDSGIKPIFPVLQEVSLPLSHLGSLKYAST